MISPLLANILSALCFRDPCPAVIADETDIDPFVIGGHAIELVAGYGRSSPHPIYSIGSLQPPRKRIAYATSAEPEFVR